MSRRSENVALTTLVVGLGAMVIVSQTDNRDRPAQQRNRYPSAAACHCEYRASQCRSDDRYGYVGPWYYSDPAQRRRDADDPGPGRSCVYAGGGYYGGSSARLPVPTDQSGSTVRSGVEHRERGGFGRTGRGGGYRFGG